MNITPPPWRMVRHSPKMVKVENKDRVIFDGFENEEENAILAAAAPELLKALESYLTGYTDEALKRLANATNGMGEISPVAASREIKARAAIAKATGQ